MQKIKLEVFKTFFNKNLTGNEIDFIIALSYLQNERGEVIGLHYKDMMESTGMSVQAFYDCKKSLTEKEVIQVKKGFNDYDITICGNDFSMYTSEDYNSKTVKYINTNQKIFRDINWKKLKPAQKLLAMDLLNINTASSFRTFRISREKFIKKYTNGIEPGGTERKGLLNISERTLQKYINMLKLYFYIGIKDGLYLITLRKQFSKKVVTSEHEVTFNHLIKAACRRNRIKNQDEKERKSILNVLVGYRTRLKCAFVDIHGLFLEMLEIINDKVFNPRKWQRRLKASLFHMLLKKGLGI